MAHAVATAGTGLVTADELFRMRDDGMRRELVRGEVRTMSPAGSRHGRVGAVILSRLDSHVREHGLGAVYNADTGFRIATDPDTVRAPDVAFVSRARTDEVGDVEEFWPGAPDLAVEVVSPSDAFTDVVEKVSEYLAAGCRMIVVVDPRGRSATVYRPHSDARWLTEDDEIDGGDVVPGWTLPLRELFG
jgi:Uma2 family endonuclease